MSGSEEQYRSRWRGSCRTDAQSDNRSARLTPIERVRLPSKIRNALNAAGMKWIGDVREVRMRRFSACLISVQAPCPFCVKRSRHQAAAQFGVAISTAINWVRRFHETGSVEPDQIGGYQPKKIAGPHRDWLVQRCRKADFTLRVLVAELDERGLYVDYHTVWDFVHAEKLSHKKRR